MPGAEGHVLSKPQYYLMTHEIDGRAAVSQVIYLIPFVSPGWVGPRAREAEQPIAYSQ